MSKTRDERDRRAKAYSYRAYRRRVQQAQAVAQRVQLAVIAGAALFNIARLQSHL